MIKVPIELKIKYLNRRMSDLALLRSSMENDDYSFAQRIGHQVKGNAVTFEVPQMAQVGMDLENAAVRRDKERIKVLIVKMEGLILRAQSSQMISKCPETK